MASKATGKAKRDANYSGNKGGEASKAERLAHLLRVGFTCPYCGADLTTCRPSIDHIVPQYAGGAKGAKNQIACCLPCNSSKQHKALQEFAARRGDAQMVKRVKRLTARKLDVARAKRLLAG
jgi:5-methylcytosine-specific restriction endonuclease McrA